MKIDDSIPSPHHGSRRGAEIEGSIIHYTAAGSAKGSARWFANHHSKVSAHYVISRDGEIFQCVDLDRAAWHAGGGQMILTDGSISSQVNQHTIGYELANWGPLSISDAGDFLCYDGQIYKGPDPVWADLDFGTMRISAYWEPYPEVQIDAIERLIRLNSLRYPKSGRLFGHLDVERRTGRKIDPGPLFPWDRFTRTHSKARSKINDPTV